MGTHQCQCLALPTYFAFVTFYRGLKLFKVITLIEIQQFCMLILT